MTCNTFGVGKSTLSETVKKVCAVINQRLGPKVLKLPQNEKEMKELIDKFKHKFGFPQTFGCIDGTHVPIRQPTENCHDFFCYKMKYSLNCQAVCDYRGIFLDVDVRWPGSVHDARVYSNSDIKTLFQQKRIPMVYEELLPGDDKIPPIILGDPAYPLLPNLMKEYTSCNSNKEVVFNEMLRSGRNQIECAFGRLKARWRILNRPINMKLEHVPDIIYACFVLHNFCQLNDCDMNDDVVQQQIEYEHQTQRCGHHENVDRLHTYNSAQGTFVRNVITDYFDNYL